MSNNKTFSMNYRIPYAETDQMGVVYHSHYLVYFERLRSEIFRTSGFLYKTIENLGYVLPVVEVKCRYKSPAFYDDLIKITGSIVAFEKNCQIKIKNKIFRENTLLVEGYTIHVFVDKKTKRIKILAKSYCLL